MNVASLELCRELYELSGWTTPIMVYNQMTPEDIDLVINPRKPKKIGERTWTGTYYPAYDLGYLLRKLPFGTRITNGGNMANRFYDIRCAGCKAVARTPEDTAAKLAIELFKQNILTKDNH